MIADWILTAERLVPEAVPVREIARAEAYRILSQKKASPSNNTRPSFVSAPGLSRHVPLPGTGVESCPTRITEFRYTNLGVIRCTELTMRLLLT